MHLRIAHIHVWDQKNKGDVAIVQAVQQLLQHKFDDVEFVEFPIEVLKSYDKSALAKINSCDLVIFGGGGILYWYFLPFNAQMIESINPPLVIFGVGYIQEIGYQELTTIQTESIKALCDKASLVSVRDDYTMKVIGKSGSKTTIDVLGDPVILLAETPADFTFNNHPRIGLNLNYSGWLGFGKHEKQILASYQEVIDYFGKKASFYYCLHHPDERKIVNKLQYDLPIIDLPASEQKWAYSKLDLLIGMMLHSCVMAFGAGTVAINIGYDIRNQSFAEFTTNPELNIPVNLLKSGVLLERVNKVLLTQEVYHAKIAAKKADIIQGYDQFLAKIQSLTSGID